MQLEQMRHCCGILELSSISYDEQKHLDKFGESFITALTQWSYDESNGPLGLVIYVAPHTDGYLKIIDQLRKEGWEEKVVYRAPWHRSENLDKEWDFMSVFTFDTNHLWPIWKELTDAYLDLKKEEAEDDEEESEWNSDYSNPHDYDY